MEKGEIAQMSNFTFFLNVFHAICILKSFDSHITVVICSFFEFWTVSKWFIREWVNLPLIVWRIFQPFKQQINVWCLTLFSTSFHLYLISQCTYPSFSAVLLTSTRHIILFKALAAFQHYHRRTMEAMTERNESWDRILTKPAGLLKVRITSNFSFSLNVFKRCFTRGR